MTAFARAEGVLTRARADRVCSAVSAEVGTGSAAAWHYSAGRLSFDPASPAVEQDTIFDLASLTKVLSTTALVAGLAATQRMDVEARIADRLASWTAPDRASVTVRDLLEHCSGLPAWRRYFERIAGRHAYEAAISSEPLEYEPRRQSIYSDLGFMLLGFIVEDIGGDSLDDQFNRWRDAAGIRGPLSFRLGPDAMPRVAFTEDDPWRGRVLQGEVHDENACALGGAAGHAGLFGTAAAVGDAARWWMRLLDGSDDPATGLTAAVARSFVQRSTVTGSSRAMGWDTMLTSSSCGARFSAQAIGHTGFTGTSLWIDPAENLYAVLLTNRVHPTRIGEGIQDVRRAFHDAVMQDLQDG